MTFSQNVYGQHCKQNQSPHDLSLTWLVSLLCLTAGSVSWTDGKDPLMFSQHLSMSRQDFSTLPSYYPLPGCCYRAWTLGLFELYSFQFFPDLGLLPDHCSSPWSLGFLLTQCRAPLKELGRQSLSMMLASWFWFRHHCSAEIYNWSLQLGKVKYPFWSPSQKG